MQNFYTIAITLITTVVTAWLTGLISSQQYWKQKKADLDAEYSSRFNTKKWEVYTEFARLVPDITCSELSNINQPIEIPSLNSLASQIVIAGSDEVVTAFRVWRETVQIYGQSNELAKAKLSNLIAEMRRDLGNKYTRLNKEDLLGSLELVS